MNFSFILSLVGGLILFLYGMGLMSNGLELACGNKMQKIIEDFTSNRFKGLLIGAIVTAVIQSSSATAVMVVGFVNAQLMTLKQAIGVIMGANIGTTITGQLIALDIVGFAPVIALIGFLMQQSANGKKNIKFIGQALLGLGFLFMGMEFMSNAMEPLQDSPAFINLLTNLRHPLLGIFAGAAITAVIQSSSASLGILQVIANQGLVHLSGSMYIICGFNIGTCITSLLSSIGTSRNARRTAIIHILFNVFGTIIFVFASLLFPIDEFIISISNARPAAQIANMHTFFNLLATVVLFPFADQLAKLASMIITGEDRYTNVKTLIYINPQGTSKDPLSLFPDIRAETSRMYKLAERNFYLAMDSFHGNSEALYDEILDNEEVINFLNTNISKHIIANLSKPMDDELAEHYSDYLRIVRDIERMSDHIKSLAEQAEYVHECGQNFSQQALGEMDDVRVSITGMFNTIASDMTEDEKATSLRSSYKRMHRVAETYRNNHMQRLKQGVADSESGIAYEKILIAFERIVSYLSNAGKLIVT